MDDIFDRLKKAPPQPSSGPEPDIFDRLQSKPAPKTAPTPAPVQQPVLPKATPQQAQPVQQGSDWNQYVEKYGKQYNVDPDLIRAVIKQESQGNPNAVSKKGAVGLMQLMPSLSNLLKIDAKKPKENIYGGTAHLADMIKMFNGNIPNALAAYNAGEVPVKKAGGVPNIPETQDYVKRVMDNYQSFKTSK